MFHDSLEKILFGKKIKRIIEAYFSELKRHYGLKQIDIDILSYFSANPGNCSSNLCEYFGLNKGQVSSSVDRLASVGYLIPAKENNYRRYLGFIVTDKANSIIEEIEKKRLESESVIFDGISDDEKEQFDKILGIILNNMENLVNIIESKNGEIL